MPHSHIIFSTDIEVLLQQLETLELHSTVGRTSDLAMDDILRKMSEVKEKFRNDKLA